MGRHSRGSGEAPAPLPDPPTRHPYAPRSTEDTGDWDRGSYRVVDVGLPPDTPGAAGSAEPLRSGGEPRGGHGAARAEPAPLPPHHAGPQTRPGDPRGRSAPDAAALGGPRFGASDPGESRFGGAPAEPRFGVGRPPDVGEPHFGATRADLAGTRFGGAAPGAGEPAFGGSRPDADPHFRGPATGPAESRFGGEPQFGATRADLAQSRFGGEPQFGAARADLAESRFGGEPQFGATRADLAQSRFGGEPQFGAARADLAESRFGRSAADPGESRFGGGRADVGESRFRDLDPAESRFRDQGPGESRFGGPRFGAGESRLPAPVDPGLAPVRADLAEPRFGATRLDLAEPRPALEGGVAEPRFGATRADLAASVGSTALAPRPAPDPDEVTDTGARRARSAFRVATEDDEDEHDAEEPDEHEPALILQWGIFVAQTLTGAIAGLGVWLGFYRLWSTWPFYAVPAVGVAAIGMLVLARALRRRHGRDLDLLTAVVTVGVSTVLTVLPAAFTLHGLTQ
jgi:hypothetical protein